MNRNSKVFIATAALLTIGSLTAACGSSTASPTSAGLRATAQQFADAYNQNDASALVEISSHDTCPISMGSAVIGLTMGKAFGLKHIEIVSVAVNGDHGSVVWNTDPKPGAYTFVAGHWTNDMPAGGCDKF